MSNHINALTVAERLASLFPNALILLVIRCQQNLLRSLYDMHPYRRDDPRKIVRRWDEWLGYMLSETAGVLSGALYYADILEKYRALFGAENVSVFLFERLFREAAEIRRLADTLSIDPDETVRRLRQPAANIRSEHGLRNLGRRINGRFHLSSVLPQPMIRAIVRLGSRFYRGRKTLISGADLERIAATYAADNRRTAALLDEDLAQYGYLMDEPPGVESGERASA